MIDSETQKKVLVIMEKIELSLSTLAEYQKEFEERKIVALEKLGNCVNLLVYTESCKLDHQGTKVNIQNVLRGMNPK